MLYYSAVMLVGFLILFKSADQFVIGAVATARNLSISPMVVGLTVVALGTSAPEIFVAATSSLQGEPELAVGNAIGSNITNIGMVLGLTALFSPLKFRVDILRNDMPILIFVTLCAGAALIDLYLGFWDGALLFIGLVLFVARLVAEQRRSTSLELVAELSEIEEVAHMTTLRAMITLLVSLVFLLVSSELLVWAVVRIAAIMGINEIIIGLTVIAVGTSLPELVVSITSAIKGQTDLAVGNIVGSNIFNILAVLAIPGVLHPAHFHVDTLQRDYALMLVMTLALVVFAYDTGRGARITRLEGAIFFVTWAGYIVYLYIEALGTAT